MTTVREETSSPSSHLDMKSDQDPGDPADQEFPNSSWGANSVFAHKVLLKQGHCHLPLCCQQLLLSMALEVEQGRLCTLQN